MKLDDLVRTVDLHMKEYSFVEQWMDFELPGQDLDYINSDKSKYYRAIQTFGDLFDGKRFCDLGTWWGLSACAAYGSFNRIDTFEIDINQIHNPETLRKHCNLTLFDWPEQCLQIDFSPYDLVLVDVSAEGGFKDGEMELLLHERLKTTYNGIAMYDDIDLSEGTKAFWDKVELPKVSIPDWHNSTWHDPSIVPGFGVVDYRKGLT